MRSVFILAAFIVLDALRVKGEVSGLISTGTDGKGSLLPIGSIQAGWTITAVTPPEPALGLTPADPPSSAFVVDSYLNWMSPSSSSASGWISYRYPLYTGGDESRLFTYSLTFNADSGDRFLTRMAGDNGVSVFLNNTTSLVGDWSFDPASGLHFQSWSPWFEVSGLSPGENTLLFVVSNLSGDSGNPTGLRVEFAAIPEPSVLVLCAIGLAACGIRRLARSSSQIASLIKPLLSIGCMLAWWACASVASASQFVNGSFEDPATFFKVLYTGESIPGWTVLGGTVDLNGYGLWQPSHGEMSVDMVGTPARGAIAQTLQFDETGSYYLRFDLSRNPNINYTTASMGIWSKASDLADFVGLGVFTFDKLNQTADMMWEQMGTASFTVGPGRTTFVFEALTGGDGPDTASWGGAVLDNVQLVSGVSSYSPQMPPPFVLPDPLEGHYTVYDDVGPGGVPEPATLILLVVSFPLFVVALRRT